MSLPAAHGTAILFMVPLCPGGKAPAEEILSLLEGNHLCGRSSGTSRWRRLLLVAGYFSIRWFFTALEHLPQRMGRREPRDHREAGAGRAHHVPHSPPSRFDTRHLISKLSDKARFLTEKHGGFFLFCFVRFFLTNQMFPLEKEKGCTLQVFQAFFKVKQNKKHIGVFPERCH